MKAETFTKNDLQYKLIGLSENDINSFMKNKKINYRVLTENDVVSAEFVGDRINIIIDKNKKIVDAYLG